MNKESGFSLVELMVAGAILAILLGLGMPLLQTSIQNTQIRTAAESMLSGMNLARTEALRRNARVTLWLVNGLGVDCARGGNGTSWVVGLDNPAGACNAAASDTTVPRLIQSRAGSDGSAAVSVSALSAANTPVSCITFNGFGGVEAACTGGGDPIALVNVTSALSGTRSLRVVVEVGGAIRLCDSSAGAPAATSC